MIIADRFYADTVSPNLQKFKGHAQIDLMRKGKVVKRVEHDNTITPALSALLSNQFLGNATTLNRAFKTNQFFGGCFLVDNTIDVSQGIPTVLPTSVNITAHAGQQPNASDLITKRGSPNRAEAHEGDNNSYTFVWDWKTSEGNGDIGAVCLTHETNGYNGIGTDESGQNYAWLLNPTAISFKDTYVFDVDTEISAENGIWFNDDNTYYAVFYTNKVFTIQKRVRSVFALRFNENRILETHTVATTINFPTGTWSGRSLTVYDGYMYFTTSGGNNKISICKVSLSDFSSEDITITLPFTYSFPASYPQSWQVNRVPIYGGYLYLNANNKIYKININNVADIKELENPDGVQINAYLAPIYKSGDLLFAGTRANGICIINDVIRRAPYDMNFDANTDYQNTMSSANISGAITRINSNRQIYQFLAPNFISTVNNLDNVVTKTPDLTMKLTYTISEV